MSEKSLPPLWNQFLTEFDGLLAEPLSLYRIGGFAFSFFYSTARDTADLDYCSVVPANVVNLEQLAGRGSLLHQKHKVCLHRVAVNTMPDGFAERSTEMLPGHFKQLRLLVPDPYDIILSKLERNDSKDRDDANLLFRSYKLEVKKLRDRYAKFQRPYLLSREEWHDQTLDMWIEIFTASS